jgi:hypothetical protein
MAGAFGTTVPTGTTVSFKTESRSLPWIVAVLGGADCERIRAGLLAQPFNAVSSLAYVAVGLWLLGRTRARGSHRTILVGGGATLVTVGVGSFAYHGPQPGWADTAHDASIAGLALVTAFNHAWLLRLRQPRGTARLLTAWKKAAPWIPPALVAYWAGRTASSLCRPASTWQYHAVWHISSALALGLVTRWSGDSAGRPWPRHRPGRQHRERSDDWRST